MQLETLSKTAEGVLTLLALKGIGPRRAADLARRFVRLSDIAEAVADSLMGTFAPGCLESLADESAWRTAHDRALRELDEASRQDVRVLSCFDSEYPVLLTRIPDPPVVLYVKGVLAEGLRAVACVGTRHPSEFGSTVARRLSRFLGKHGWSIISGLAIGIDAACHEAALQCNAHTVAILGNGLDTIYPKKNEELARRIVAQGGALLSEQPFGTKAFPSNLVKRDRLQSGMSVAAFVMETDIAGGTMHTVRYALSYGRLLFVPVPTTKYQEHPKAQGIRALAEQAGHHLAEVLRADATYRQLLRDRFASRPPAIPIKGKEQYGVVLRRLEEAASREERGETTRHTDAPLFRGED